MPWLINSSPSRQNGRCFAEDIFKCIFLNEKFYIVIPISLKCGPKYPVEKKWALVQVMAWRRTLSESMSAQVTDAYMRHLGDMS